MIYFQKVLIENFQSHVHTECIFHPGLNVFVGPSDSGKSAILRALRWVLFNTPRGTDFIRAGAKQCKVELHLSDGTIISRIRNHSTLNRYLLKKLGEEELIFEGFGSEVPLEITSAHQIRPLQLEQKDILLQMGHQLEGPFLLSESSGMKAKTIGLVSGAHLIDVALKKLNSDRNQLSIRRKYLQNQQQAIEQKLLPFENLTNLEQALNLGEKKTKELKKKQLRLSKLRQLLDTYQKNRQEQIEQRNVLEKYPYLYEMEQKRTELEYKLLKLRQYRQVLDRHVKATQELKQQHTILKQTELVDVAETRLINQIDRINQSQHYKQIQEKYLLLQREKQEYQEIYKRTNQTDNAAMKCEKLISDRRQWQQYVSLQTKWNQLTIVKEKEQTILKKSSHIPTLIKERVPKIESKLLQLLALTRLGLNLTEIQDRVAKGQDWIVLVSEKLQKFLMEYSDLLMKQGKCPTCGSQINEDLIEHLLHEIEGGSSHAAAGRED